MTPLWEALKICDPTLWHHSSGAVNFSPPLTPSRWLALCRERLLAAGFTDEEDARLHAPIGLAIGAQTPEEIAVSVAAEMIAVRAGLENGLRRPLG